MILFVTTAAHRYTLRSLVGGTFGAEVPECDAVSYEQLFAATTLPTATYVFTDFDRLFPWEVMIAAEMYRRLRDRAMRCLNDPARVMGRFELLRALHDRGYNPFDAYRADERPRPRRFPVFLRGENDHVAPRPALLRDQPELERALERRRAAGIPLHGLLVVEFAGEPIAPGVWRKFGTFRTGEAMSVSHAVVTDRWVVKGVAPAGLLTAAMLREELAVVTTNVHAARLRTAFEIAGIEWGRADHATFAGREIVYEINTNPTMRPFVPVGSPERDEALLRSRRRMAGHLHAIDTPPGPAIALDVGPQLERYRTAMRRLGGTALPRP
ncbi:MAG: hypothetical protein IT561_25950 [Alphaproteobacteria bacterium]|nr:hypothetical protein [Alphaproteobacteria bacterium]